MRTELIEYLQGQNLGAFVLSQELPWSSSGEPLYTKNAKKIYVDKTQYSTDPLISTLDGLNITNTIFTVRLFFSNDAKQLPPSYDDLITTLRSAKDTSTITGVSRRDVVVSSAFEEDVLVTELEYRFTKLT
jgi:hypothetical protein